MENTRGTLFAIGFTVALLLFAVLVFLMAWIVGNGGLPMMETIHATLPLLAGPTRVLHHHNECGHTWRRDVHLSGRVLLATDRRVSLKVISRVDGTKGLAAVENSYSDLLDADTVYRVTVIFDEQAHRHGANDAFQYIVKERA